MKSTILRSDHVFVLQVYWIIRHVSNSLERLYGIIELNKFSLEKNKMISVQKRLNEYYILVTENEEIIRVKGIKRPELRSKCKIHAFLFSHPSVSLDNLVENSIV